MTWLAEFSDFNTILAACDAEAAGLIVTGVARNEALSRIVLGSTVDALARRSPVPLLVVRSRARAPYREVVVASDFSPSSRRALETAAVLFPDAGFTLFHAFGNPYPALSGMDAAQTRNHGHQLAQREAGAPASLRRATNRARPDAAGLRLRRCRRAAARAQRETSRRPLGARHAAPQRPADRQRGAAHPGAGGE